MHVHASRFDSSVYAYTYLCTERSFSFRLWLLEATIERATSKFKWHAFIEAYSPTERVSRTRLDSLCACVRVCQAYIFLSYLVISLLFVFRLALLHIR